jgi:hypothetical protein
MFEEIFFKPLTFGRATRLAITPKTPKMSPITAQRPGFNPFFLAWLYATYAHSTQTANTNKSILTLSTIAQSKADF